VGGARTEWDASPGCPRAARHSSQAQQVGELGVLGDGRSQQPQALGGGTKAFSTAGIRPSFKAGLRNAGEVGWPAEAPRASGHLRTLIHPCGSRARPASGGDHHPSGWGVAFAGLLATRAGDDRLPIRLDASRLAFAPVAGALGAPHIDARHTRQGRSRSARGAPRWAWTASMKAGSSSFARPEQARHRKRARARSDGWRSARPAPKHETGSRSPRSLAQSVMC